MMDTLTTAFADELTKLAQGAPSPWEARMKRETAARGLGKGPMGAAGRGIKQTYRAFTNLGKGSGGQQAQRVSTPSPPVTRQPVAKQPVAKQPSGAAPRDERFNRSRSLNY